MLVYGTDNNFHQVSVKRKNFNGNYNIVFLDQLQSLLVDLVLLQTCAVTKSLDTIAKIHKLVKSSFFTYEAIRGSNSDPGCHLSVEVIGMN